MARGLASPIPDTTGKCAATSPGARPGLARSTSGTSHRPRNATAMAMRVAPTGGRWYEPCRISSDVTIGTDFKSSVRGLIRAPASVIALVVTIAGGVGGNAVVFGFVHGTAAREI